MGIAWYPPGSAEATPVPLSRTWRVRGYRFVRCGGTMPGGRWICEAHGRGAGFCRTPVGAWLALRKFLRDDPPR